jgi:peptidoglycan/LPS O-acetylase OafA/YrhL
VETRKPARLNALTGLRCFAAINIVFFIFPIQMVWLAGAGGQRRLRSVSFFILLSGFVLAITTRAGAGRKLDKVRFWKARFTRLYPIYLLSLLLSWRMVPVEYARTRTPCSGRAWC